jgi:hypothetical protein
MSLVQLIKSVAAMMVSSQAALASRELNGRLRNLVSLSVDFCGKTQPARPGFPTGNAENQPLPGQSIDVIKQDQILDSVSACVVKQYALRITLRTVLIAGRLVTPNSRRH